jgi:hypothetical protein
MKEPEEQDHETLSPSPESSAWSCHMLSGKHIIPLEAFPGRSPFAKRLSYPAMNSNEDLQEET